MPLLIKLHQIWTRWAFLPLNARNIFRSFVVRILQLLKTLLLLLLNFTKLSNVKNVFPANDYINTDLKSCMTLLSKSHMTNEKAWVRFFVSWYFYLKHAARMCIDTLTTQSQAQLWKYLSNYFFFFLQVSQLQSAICCKALDSVRERSLTWAARVI